jgi:sugar phosphate isomerase/epimerase
VAAAVQYGFDGIEIRLVDGEVVTPDIDAGVRRRVAGALEREGVPVAALDSSLLAVGTVDPDAFDRDIDAFIGLAEQWGSPVVRVFGGPVPDAGPARREVITAAARRLDRAASLGEQRRVRVAVETHDSFSSAAAVAELLAQTRHPWVGAVYDSHHPHRVGESPEQVLRLLGDRLALVQVKDARWEAEQRRWVLVPLGEGEVPVARLLEQLPGHGYDGWVSLEWEKRWWPELAEPEAALPAQLATLRSWLAA